MVANHKPRPNYRTPLVPWQRGGGIALREKNSIEQQQQQQQKQDRWWTLKQIQFNPLGSLASMFAFINALRSLLSPPQPPHGRFCHSFFQPPWFRGLCSFCVLVCLLVWPHCIFSSSLFVSCTPSSRLQRCRSPTNCLQSWKNIPKKWLERVFQRMK